MQRLDIVLVWWLECLPMPESNVAGQAVKIFEKLANPHKAPWIAILHSSPSNITSFGTAHDSLYLSRGIPGK